jgi:FkbM family methyltransferase
VGAEPGVAKFYICEHKASSSLIFPDLSSKWLTLKAKILGFAPNYLYVESQVVVTTVDQVVEENSTESMYLLKIDTEGAELDVI